jgi:hypothetical protein
MQVIEFTRPMRAFQKKWYSLGEPLPLCILTGREAQDCQINTNPITGQADGVSCDWGRRLPVYPGGITGGEQRDPSLTILAQGQTKKVELKFKQVMDLEPTWRQIRLMTMIKFISSI